MKTSFQRDKKQRMMVSLLIAYLLTIQTIYGHIHYLEQCNQHQPICLQYNDGCDICSCDPITGQQTCTQS